MKVTKTKDSPTRITLEIEIEQEKVDSEFEKLFNQARRQLVLHGFRKGKVPPKLAARHIKDELLASDVLEHIVPPVYTEALEQEGIIPVSEPELDFKPPERGMPFVFKASLEVKPEIELADYKGVEVVIPKIEVKEENVEEVLKSMQKAATKMVPVEDESYLLAEGDRAIIDFESSENGKPVDRGSGKDFLLEMDPEKFVPGFSDNLVGMKKGDDKEFSITFPEDYPSDLKGRTLDFKVLLKEVRKMEMPELNDSLAKEVSKKETLEELKEDIRKDLQANLDEQEQGAVQDRVIEKLLPGVDAELSEAFINYETNYILNDINKQLKWQGASLESFLASKKQSIENLKTELRPQAERLAKIELIIDAVARLESIAVTDEDINKDIQDFADQTDQDPARIKKTMEDEGTIPALKYNLLKRKVLKFLAENAKVDRVIKAEEEKEKAEEKIEEPVSE
ncbi:MAG: trigger factor [Chloroflexi bacterium]|nr:trigger factor [Chloroflexota bacterium]